MKDEASDVATISRSGFATDTGAGSRARIGLHCENVLRDSLTPKTSVPIPGGGELPLDTPVPAKVDPMELARVMSDPFGADSEDLPALR